MPLETYIGPEIGELLTRARARFGSDAVVLHTRPVRHWDGSTAFEVLAGDAGCDGLDVRRVLTRGSAPQLTGINPLAPDASPPLRRGGRRSLVIALVGPTGAGKTTTIAKLAGHPDIFGRHHAGIISLDTYRVGAVEQLRIYADIARTPLEIVYDAPDLGHALRRLDDCDVILIDTPGRGPQHDGDRDTVQRWLDTIAPDEVHLVMPAGLQADWAAAVVARYRGSGMTHVLATKLDEVPEDWHAFELAAAHRLPMRWIADGQEVPTDIRGAAPRLLAALARQTEPALAGGGSP